MRIIWCWIDNLGMNLSCQIPTGKSGSSTKPPYIRHFWTAGLPPIPDIWVNCSGIKSGRSGFRKTYRSTSFLWMPWTQQLQPFISSRILGWLLSSNSKMPHLRKDGAFCIVAATGRDSLPLSKYANYPFIVCVLSSGNNTHLIPTHIPLVYYSDIWLTNCT